MEYTQNYQLPLWDKEDAVKRTDFNENNQKIDAALGQAADRVKLMEMTTTEDAQQVDLDVSGIDLTAYECITVYISNISVASNLYFRLNNISDNVYYESGSVGNCLTSISPVRDGVGSVKLRLSGDLGAIFCCCTTEFLNTYSLNNTVRYYPHTSKTYCGIHTDALMPEDLHSINVYLYPGTGTIPAGVQFCVVGTFRK